ncbi:PTS glucose transporter subunit IIA [Streptomyces sp. ISL-22]|uniref:PTS glucose transporter subunit IIA n=1 Tax=Streptomyces curacoi TaxID=146536 RepID=A0A124GY27_9ACTN|nr:MULTISPECIES: PTS glucose transporter subunit IIA [Streptomyces]KUM71580.1 PTS glucose transporter subunit IIA [Streptomyces curacoi]MBT2420386.1 PTS glucose transporter subunit IIA [Streptomyces sp. ISL-24]MBT2437813.1 PTS glucose transporter subunit IIA [Streptomyces sp. ISL-22]
MTTVTSPLVGRAVGLASVPDPVFSGAMVGPGTAIDPVREPSEAVSPVDGVIVSLHPHAFVVVDEQGHGVLTHLGIDTVQLNGEGFELLVNKGDTVQRGQGIVRWDPSAVEAAGKSPVCPIVALEATAEALSDLRDDGDVKAGDSLFVWK